MNCLRAASISWSRFKKLMLHADSLSIMLANRPTNVLVDIFSSEICKLRPKIADIVLLIFAEFIRRWIRPIPNPWQATSPAIVRIFLCLLSSFICFATAKICSATLELAVSFSLRSVKPLTACRKNFSPIGILANRSKSARVCLSSFSSFWEMGPNSGYFWHAFK